MDRAAWSAAVHGVVKSQTWLSNWTALNFKLKVVQKQPICRIQPTFFFFLMKKIKDIGYFYQQNLALTIRSLHLVMEFPLSLDLHVIAMIEERTRKGKAVVVSDFVIFTIRVIWGTKFHCSEPIKESWYGPGCFKPHRETLPSNQNKQIL